MLQPERLSVTDAVTEVVETNTTTHDAATVDWTVDPSDLHVYTDPVILSLLLENIVENAIIHSESAETTVCISVSKSGEASETPEASETARDVRFEIRDSDERIPEHEIETLRAGEETSLQHGQGIGLWIAYWCTRKLRGDMRFEYDDGNVLTLTI